MEQWDHKTGLAPETDGTTIVTISAAVVIYRHKNVDHLATQSELPNRERDSSWTHCWTVSHGSGHSLLQQQMQMLQGSSSGVGWCSSAASRPCWHMSHQPRQDGKFQYPYWKQQWGAELWIPAVHWHFIPWLRRSFDFGPEVLTQQMGCSIKMWSHKYSVQNPSCRERQMQPPRKNRYEWFQQVPAQWVGYYRLARSPLCHAALPCHSDEGFLSWLRELMMVRAYALCFTSPQIQGGHLVPLPSSPHLGNTQPTVLGVQTTSCHHPHNEHHTETENWEELTHFLFIFCNLVQLNPNIKYIFKQQSYWE